MKLGKKIQRKLERRQKNHNLATDHAKKRMGVTFKPSAWKKPGSRNHKKTG